jgi:hypothetical protein
MTPFGAYTELLASLFGVQFLFLPFMLSYFGLSAVAGAMAFSVAINLFCSWLLESSTKIFGGEAVVTNLHDLTYLCFGNSIIALQEFVRVLTTVLSLVLATVYLGQEVQSLQTSIMPGVSYFHSNTFQLCAKISIHFASFLVLIQVDRASFRPLIKLSLALGICGVSIVSMFALLALSEMPQPL